MACSQRSLATDHVGAITEHGDANERIAISMPVDDGLIIFPRTTRDTFISVTVGLLLQSLLDSLDLLLGVGGNVDVSDLKVDRWDKLDTGNLGYNVEDLRTAPGVIDERSKSVPFLSVCVQQVVMTRGDLLWSVASELAMGKVAGVLAIVPDRLAQDLCSHLLNGFLGEERERLRYGHRRDTLLCKTNFLHGPNPFRGHKVEVFCGIEGNLFGSG